MNFVLCSVLLFSCMVHCQITTDMLLNCPKSCTEICPNDITSCRKTVSTSQDLKNVTMHFECLHTNGTVVSENIKTYANPEVGANFGTKCSEYSSSITYTFGDESGDVRISVSGDEDKIEVVS